jgi:hypothetical protein
MEELETAVINVIILSGELFLYLAPWFLDYPKKN